jgi:2-keto-4-pentenoate hydratase/2-oxohepta-3-ene-1,7-dioic acid hydratase in catechol pathway
LKLVRYLHNSRESYGIQINDDRLLDVPGVSKIANKRLPLTLGTMVSDNRGLKALEDLIHALPEAKRKKAMIDFENVKILAPIASPGKIICLGRNYREHAEEQGASVPTEPIIFMKPRTAIINPGDSIVKPTFVNELDYEAELALIIGEKGKNITAEKASEHIFGYTCFNDVSARDIQFRDKQWTRGKGFDTFAPMGPCIATQDQIDDPNSLWIKTKVNGELRQNSSTQNMVFGVYQLIHELSKVMTLEQCDIIATGTPAGVGFAMKPKPKFLWPGDVVEIEIENIGSLRNTVRADSTT